ncbi:hypothetical protein ACFV1L_35965 [Kitasatospora sp. NPDC059646]|uniref:hypothetical protein n=1 Tax=Kitasatospora sp. NPDC059646 TaxID=3346893 RepID=UPI00369C07D4
MNDTESRIRATAYAVTAAYRELPAGHLMTRVETARRVAPLLGLAPAGAAGLRITEALAAGALVELHPAGDTRLTVPGAPAGAVVSVVPGTVEQTVEVVIENPEGTVELYLGGRGRRSGPALNLTRRSLILSAEDVERLAAELHRLWAEIQTYAPTTPEAIGEALAAAGLPGAEGAGCGWWTTHSRDGRPMVVHMDGTRLGPRRTNEDEQRHWAEQLDQVENALRLARFQVQRSAGHAVIVHGRTAPGEAQPADVVRVAARSVRSRSGCAVSVRRYLHVNCECRIGASLFGEYGSTAEALAALQAHDAELGVAYVVPIPCRKSRPETGARTAAQEQPGQAEDQGDEQGAAAVAAGAGQAGPPALPRPAVTVRPWLLRAAGLLDDDTAPQPAPAEEPAQDGPALVRAFGPWGITHDQAEDLREKARADRAAFEADSAARRAAERFHYGPEREALLLAAVEAARELLTAAGVPDLDATPTANTGVRVRRADRPGVWVMVRQVRGIGTSRPDEQRQPFDAREWDHNMTVWAGVLERAGWQTTAPGDAAFYASPPAAAEQDQDAEDVVEAELIEDQEQPAALAVCSEEQLAAVGGAAGEAVFDPRELVGSVFADGLGFEVTAPAAVKWLHLAGDALAAGGGTGAAETAVAEAAKALLAAIRTADAATWAKVARWLAGRAAQRRTGAAGAAGGDLVQEVPKLSALVDDAARSLAAWLTVRSLGALKLADQDAHELAGALHTATGTGRRTVWLQVARYAVEQEAAALVAGAARPVAELGAGSAPVRPALPAPAGAQPDAAAELRERELAARRAHDGRGALPATVRVLDYGLDSWEWGYDCDRHGEGWERQPGQWETRAEAEGAARLHAADHAEALAAVTAAEDELDQAAALGFSAAQFEALAEARLGRLCEDARGFYFDNDGFDKPRPVQGRRVMDLWARGLVKVRQDGPSCHQIILTQDGRAALDLLNRARNLGAVTPAATDTLRSTAKERAAYPRIKAAPAAGAADAR